MARCDSSTGALAARLKSCPDTKQNEAVGPAELVVLSNFLRHQFVLVRRQVIDMCGDRRAPTHTRRIERAKVVITEPTVTAELRFGRAVERVEAYPQAVRVSSFHQRAQPVHLGRGPPACVCLAARLNHSPRIVPPPPIVRGFPWIHDRGGCRRILAFGMNGAE